MKASIDYIKSVMEDREFVEMIVAMEDPAEVQKAFASKGIGFSIEEINQIAQIAFNPDLELSENEMENVTGGVLAEIAIVASGVALFANCMAEYNKSRKAKGKSTIW